MSKFIKTIVTKNEARAKMLKGMNILADAVSSTLGPRSRNVAIDMAPGHDIAPTVLHDGVSVARAINLKDVHEDMGVRLLKGASLKTNEVAGDGTTTSTILAQAIINEAFRNITAGANPMVLKQELEDGLKVVVKQLKELAKPIKTDEEMEQVASISASDPAIGKLVAEAIKKVGQDGAITIEDGHSNETTVTYTQGMEIDRGHLAGNFITDGERNKSLVEDPYILLTDKKINYAYQLIPLLDKLVKEAKSNAIVIFAGEVVEEALHFLVINKLQGKLKVIAIQAPAYGARRVEELQDLAVLTGGTVILEEAGRQIESVTLEELGRCDKIEADWDKTIISGSKGDEGAVKKRIEELREQIKNANTPYDEDIREQRLAKLTGGVAVINVGGTTDVEVKEKKERVIDAKNATKAAVEEGIVAGGEITLLTIAKHIPQGILRNALQAPFKKLIENSGLDYGDIREKMAGKEYPWGIDVTCGCVKNLIDNGIIDPVRVSRVALENAISISGAVITTETLITDLVEDK